MRGAAVILVALFVSAACGGGGNDGAGATASGDDAGAGPDATTTADAGGGEDGGHGDAGGETDGASEASDPNADNDGDCIKNSLEPVGDVDGDGIPNFLDPDSDGDGLKDGVEDKNCNGQKDADETSAYDADSDDDGATDLVEVAMATNPLEGSSKPDVTKQYVAVTGMGAGAGTATTITLPFATQLKMVDLYVLVDRSGSMSSEATTIRNNLSAVLGELRCAPAGTGAAGECIPDLWSGIGTIGYASNAPYQNLLDVQPSPNFAAASFTALASTPTQEATTFALWATVTGLGSADAAACTFTSAVSARASCASGAAASAGHATSGYPCFRGGAIPLLVVATDEAPLLDTADTYECPAWGSVVKAAALARGARVVGLYGSGAAAEVVTDLGTMATDTRAVDARNANAPLVVSGADANAASGIKTAVTSFLKGAPLDVSVTAVDDSSDGVDAVGAFIQRLTVQPTGSGCTNGLTSTDTNGDTFPDTYVNVAAATPVCFSLVTKANAAVAPTAAPQVFKARIDAKADGFSLLDSREVVFVVPPAP